MWKIQYNYNPNPYIVVKGGHSIYCPASRFGKLRHGGISNPTQVLFVGLLKPLYHKLKGSTIILLSDGREI